MAVTLESIAKVEAIIQAIKNVESKTLEANDNWTHIIVFDEEGDKYELTYTPSNKNH